MTDTVAVSWVRKRANRTMGLGEVEARVILAAADLAGEGTGVVVDAARLAEHADVSIGGLAQALTDLQALGLLAECETTMAGRLRLVLPIPGQLTVIKSDE